MSQCHVSLKVFTKKESLTFHTSISKFKANNLGFPKVIAAVDCEAILCLYLFITHSQPLIFGQIKETKSGCLLLFMITFIYPSYSGDLKMIFFFIFRESLIGYFIMKRCQWMFSFHLFQASSLNDWDNVSCLERKKQV